MEKSILEDEILQQPSIVSEIFSKEIEQVEEIANKLKGKFEYILIAARGSSDNAARYAQYLFGTFNHLPVALATPSLFTIYKQAPLLSGALVIGISQSGQSPDIVQVIREAKDQKQPTIAITNELLSPLSKSADHIINLHAGEEHAIAATKTYTASLAALALLSAKFLNDKKIELQLFELPHQMEETFISIKDQLPHIQRYRYMEHCVVIGRGLNYATSFEIALKLKELSRIVAEPYSSADFRHGPIAMVREGFPVFIIAPTGEVSPDINDLIDDLLHRKGELIIVSDNKPTLEKSHLSFPIPNNVPEWLSPLVSVIPGQLFALHLTRAKGLNPDAPQGIQKITETY
jgi:glutamine---fructose-6-phosphate transaminase (isomerizing)